MRLELTLHRSTRHRMLPMDYQYFISVWIYKVINQSDKEFARFLHNSGYGRDDSKLYKLFCFSRLNFGKPRLWKERRLFEIREQDISLQISFDVKDAAAHFIQGLFLSEEFYLGDKFNGIDFRVTKVEALPEPDFTETMPYKLQSPWVVSCKTESDKHPQYIFPDDEIFKTYAIRHLVEKFRNTRGQDSISEKNIHLHLTSKFKKSGFVMKPGTKDQTRVIGSLFEFELTAPIETHRMIWSAGVSEKSSSGFGWVEIQ